MVYECGGELPAHTAPGEICIMPDELCLTLGKQAGRAGVFLACLRVRFACCAGAPAPHAIMISAPFPADDASPLIQAAAAASEALQDTADPPAAIAQLKSAFG